MSTASRTAGATCTPRLPKRPKWPYAPSSRSSIGSRSMISSSPWARPSATLLPPSAASARLNVTAPKSGSCAAVDEMAEPLSTRTKLIWVAILYFAEGFPFGLVRSAFPVYFRSHGVSLSEIGFMSLANLPWTLKFLWAPAVDLWGRRRNWIVACQALLVIDLAVFLVLRPAQAGSVLLVLLITLAIFSATQDIAIDAYTIELLDIALGPMVPPFCVDRRLTLEQIGGVLTPMGMVSTIAGALVGGRLTKTWGLFRALWVLGIAQAASNLAYAAAAALPPSQLLVYCASFIESFCGGLGTAPFLAFLMSVCDKTQAATQYALLSALASLTGSLVGPFSGRVTQSVGYATYFTATFFLAWPAFALLPWVRMWINEEGEHDGQECHAERSPSSGSG